MKDDIIQLEKECYPKFLRSARGKINDESCILILQYDKRYSYKWRVHLYKEGAICPSNSALFVWRLFANRHFNKLIARHNFKEDVK